MRKLIRLQARRAKSGFSLAEALISLAVGAVAVAGGMAVNHEELRLVKSTRESQAASLSMEERIEQLRIATWRQITDPEYVTGTYFAARPQSIGALPGATETVKVSAFPDPTACSELIVERKERSTPAVLKNGAGLDAQRLAKVSVQIRWTSKDGRSRLRELATIISNAGISRMNLPAMGTSGSSTAAVTPPPATPSTSSTTDTTSTASTTPSDAGGNGNGRGNVGGAVGKN